MRLKTLGVIVVTALALFSVGYWLTDSARLSATSQTQDAELLDYGKRVFANNPADPSAAGCARCHGNNGQGGPVPGLNRQAPNLHSPTLANKLKVNPDYVNLVIRFGGVVVSGDVNSPMPAWSTEVGGPLTVQQIDALTALVTSWAKAAATQSQAPIPNTVAGGQEVYSSSGCAGCHQANLKGVPPTFPDISKIGSALVTQLPTPPSGLEQMKKDYAANPRSFLEKWIRDSAANYNGGTATGMPPHPVAQLSDQALQALITFLLAQK